MIRKTGIMGILLLILFLSACGSKGNISDREIIRSTTGVSDSSTGNTILPGTANNSTGAQNDNNPEPAPGVVAKSGNAVSSEDKEEVIRQLDSELDSLFERINESLDVELGED